MSFIKENAMKTVKAGIVGLGGRGIGLLKQLVKMKDIEMALKWLKKP